MAEVKISPNEIRDALAKHVAAYKPGAAAKDEIGSVTEAGDGIARVEGLPSTMTNELLKFENGTLGLALNLDVREVGVVILGEFTGIEEGTTVRRTGEILSVPVGDGFLGRVVDALGRPIDGKGEIKSGIRYINVGSLEGSQMIRGFRMYEFNDQYGLLLTRTAETVEFIGGGMWRLNNVTETRVTEISGSNHLDPSFTTQIKKTDALDIETDVSPQLLGALS